jgi:dCMP deaminase
MTANNRQVGGTHYAASIQHWDFCVQVLGNRYLEGNATKYLSRWRKKAGIQDLEKGLHYLDKTIEEVVAGRLGWNPTLDAEGGAMLIKFLEAQGFVTVAGGYVVDPTVEADIITALATWRDVETLRQARAKLADFLTEQKAREAELRAAALADLPKRPTRDQWGLRLAQVVAERGTCARRKVGGVLVDARGHILSTGYNGKAAGLPHCTDEPCSGATAPSGTNLDACEAIHAEQNALMQCADVYAIDTVYVTASPCITCVKMLINTGARRIVFLEEYPHPAAKDLWLGSHPSRPSGAKEVFQREWSKGAL